MRRRSNARPTAHHFILSPSALGTACAASLIASAASAQCGNSQSCFVANAGPGCSDVTCCQVVCELDPHCCSAAWDAACAAQAGSSCTVPTIIGGPVRNPANGHRYVIISPSSRPYLEEFLASADASLVSINGGSEHDWIRRSIFEGNAIPNFSAHIGLGDGAAEGVFVWEDGTLPTFLKWAPGEPNNLGDEDAVAMDSPNGLWRDLSIASPLPGIGEAASPTCGTGGSCYGVHDAGCDDETCCNQICELDPFCCQTTWDSACATQASFYCRAEIIGGPIVNPATGNSYFLSSEASWLSSEKLANTIGGHLVVIDGPAENEWIRQNFRPAKGGIWTWIGLHDQRYEGTFEWTTGEPVAYTNWLPGKPFDRLFDDFGAVFLSIDSPASWYDLSLQSPTFGLIEVGCVGDLDGNGVTNGIDIAILLGDWGSQGSSSDRNLDGTVDGTDLAIVLGLWGPCPTSNACSAHTTPGSDQPGCTTCVCALDPSCCQTQWDSDCVAAAAGPCNTACQCGG